MKAVEISKNGDPEALELKDISLEKPKENEVTIEHKAIGLNYIDTYHRSGLYPLKLPTGIGIEGAGIIKEIGSKVNDFKVGDKVSYAGAPLGAYATHRNYPTENYLSVQQDSNSEPLYISITRRHTTTVPLKHNNIEFYLSVIIITKQREVLRTQEVIRGQVRNIS